MYEGFYYVKNNIDSDVEIFLYDRTGLFNEEPILLKPSETKLLGGITTSTRVFFDNMENSVNTAVKADSIVTIFNNQKISYSYLIDPDINDTNFFEPIFRNILRQGSYERTGDFEFLFTITQEDFENATPCDGPCL